MRRPGPVLYAFGIYALAFAVPFLLENASELSEHLPPSLRQGLETIGAKYQRWTNGPRAHESRYTAVVTLNQKDFKVLREACKQRALVTKLLPQLVQAGAGEIVLDLAFTRTFCAETDTEHATGDLKASLIKAGAEVPVVVGQLSVIVKKDQDETDKARLLAEGLGEDDLVVKPLIDLPLQDPSYQISSGLIRLNLDPSKVPLSWTAFTEDDERVARAPSGKTLPFVVALAYRAPFPHGTAELEALLRDGVHPFTSLLAKKDFIRVKAADLLCKDQASGAFQACPKGPPADVRRQLQGKIVLLGWEDNPNDLVDTAIGTLPGVFVQANYIESLLDSRYLRVIPTWLQLLLSAVWFGCIELSFLIYKKSIEKALAGAIAVFIVGAFLFYYVAVVNLGFYLALLPPSLVAILLRCWYQWSEGKDDEKPKSAEPPPQHGNCADEASGELRSKSAPVASG
jgi:hypothetical protein